MTPAFHFPPPNYHPPLCPPPSPNLTQPSTPNHTRLDIEDSDVIIVSVDSKHIHKSKESAIEAEVKAAKERAVIPLDVRMTQFRELLAEKQVGGFGGLEGFERVWKSGFNDRVWECF